MASQESQMPFIRNLASSDRKLRTASLASLQTFLASRKTLSATDAQKLWKGLFYALWMTDRPLPQQALAGDLAWPLLSQLSGPAVALPWLRAFWAVVAAQWTDIDVLRLDKFLLLVRRVFAAHVRWAAARRYQGPDVDALLDTVLAAYPFEGEGDLRAVPLGVRLHVLDLWVDELEREGALADEDAAPFVKRVGDLVDALRRGPVRPVRERAAESHQDERLPWGKQASEDENEEGGDDDDGWGGIED